MDRSRGRRRRSLNVGAVEMLDRCSFPASDAPLPMAVSGGADSVAMALLARKAGRDIVVWHVHHGLRAAADDDAEFVRAFADGLDATFQLRRVDLAPGGDLEARARAARYDALPADVCVGHTADDRAETVLLNLFRGAGLAGVAARMARVARPIIRLRRHETVAVCAAAGIEARDDEMNHDPAYRRVGVRDRLLPAIEAEFGRDPVPLLNRHADLVADALVVIERDAAALDATDAAAVSDAPRSVAGEALRSWMARELGSADGIDRAAIDRVLLVADGTHIAAELPGGHRVARTAGVLRIERAT
ncbi:MAG: tRNA lysidine(34) synthetase TilS [Acidimicrobiales bacterium]